VRKGKGDQRRRRCRCRFERPANGGREGRKIMPSRVARGRKGVMEREERCDGEGRSGYRFVAAPESEDSIGHVALVHGL
jgi:hypothetical protein